MKRHFAAGWKAAILRVAVMGAALLIAGQAAAQKRGGILTMPLIDTPPSPSLHEEATISVVVPFMSMFNNLIQYDQHVMQNRDDTVVPDLATKWDWNEDKTALTFTLREGVK